LRPDRLLAALAVLALLVPASRADIVIPGANGSDGALNVTANTTIDLSQAVAASWDATSPSPGKGVYDGAKWAVVFKYSSVNIASGVTLSFKNNASHAPVVWLVNGNVTISGTVNLDGANGVISSTTPGPTEPGPGGFRGGPPFQSATLLPGYGFGPGAPVGYHTGGSYSQVGAGTSPGTAYGNTLIVPLVGGSGGAAYSATSDRSGGAGGGAILIAATAQVTVNGTISAVGGDISSVEGCGSGGAVRIMANALGGTGIIRAIGGIAGSTSGGDGFIRLEALSVGGNLNVLPATAVEPPTSPVTLWAPTTAPSVRVVSVGASAVPSDPSSSLGPAPADVRFYSAAPLTVTIETKNVDTVNSKVTLRVTPKYGPAVLVAATYASGTTATALWTAPVSVPQGFSAMQPRVDPK
jgi:hypothetical protein